ncbi:MAG TPA: tetratricopeptide repeat protein [Gammaproteobacteria bacterium]|nr:tetratricopeptide repeat protein [Gammaproteobacteria bacterium]
MVERFRRCRRWHVVALLMLAGGARAQSEQPFAAGTEAFEQGDYLRALSLFERAQSEGADSAALRYNIGVCQYRTGDYAEAETTFRDLAARFPAFAALAEYNRGLSLLALQRRDEAAAAFRRARAEGDERLAALADSALVELAMQAEPPAPRWRGYFSAAAGHDDNVALVDELSLPANVAAASPLTELLGYARHQTRTRVPLRVDLSGYIVRYADSTVFDQDAFRVDTAFLWSAGDAWGFEAGPYFSNSTLDGDGFERTLGAQLLATRSLGGRLAFDVRLIYEDIESPSARFDFVSGHGERLRFGVEHGDANRRLRVSYEFEAQDRVDPGVSPDRNRLQLRLGQRLRSRWSIDGGLAYRTSRYGKLAVPRNERLVELVVGARRTLRNDWALNTDYRWADNNSNIALFGYTSRRVTVGVSRTF